MLCVPEQLLLAYELILKTTDVSQHSHEIGLANLSFTRRGRRAQAAAAKSVSADPNPPVPEASPSQPGGSSLPTGAAGAAPPTRPQPDPSSSSHTLHSYPHFPSISMPLPQGFGAPMSFPAPASISAPAAGPSSAPVPAAAPPLAPPLPFPAPSQTQAAVSTDRARMERERWDRMDVLYQSIHNNARQFEYPAASVAALESVLMRMYFESPLSAPHPQPHSAYGAPTVPLAQAAPQPPLPPGDTTMVHEDQSNDDESEGDDDENEEIEAIC